MVAKGGPMSNMERLIYRLSLWLDWVARGAMIAILLLSIANIVSTAVWRPIFGTYELVGFLTVVTLSCALAYCTISGGHVAVDILVSRFSPRTQTIFDIVTGILSLTIFVILGWQTALYATNMWQKGELSGTLMWPFYPLVYCISFGCFVTCVVLLLNLGKAVAKAVDK
jgi:TRAP-type C4-dicarboxylate transport system permease small subunit